MKITNLLPLRTYFSNKKNKQQVVRLPNLSNTNNSSSIYENENASSSISENYKVFNIQTENLANTFSQLQNYINANPINIIELLNNPDHLTQHLQANNPQLLLNLSSHIHYNLLVHQNFNTHTNWNLILIISTELLIKYRKLLNPKQKKLVLNNQKFLQVEQFKNFINEVKSFIESKQPIPPNITNAPIISRNISLSKTTKTEDIPDNILLDNSIHKIPILNFNDTIQAINNLAQYVQNNPINDILTSYVKSSYLGTQGNTGNYLPNYIIAEIKRQMPQYQHTEDWRIIYDYQNDNLDIEIDYVNIIVTTHHLSHILNNYKNYLWFLLTLYNHVVYNIATNNSNQNLLPETTLLDEDVTIYQAQHHVNNYKSGNIVKINTSINLLPHMPLLDKDLPKFRNQVNNLNTLRYIQDELKTHNIALSEEQKHILETNSQLIVNKNRDLEYRGLWHKPISSNQFSKIEFYRVNSSNNPYSYYAKSTTRIVVEYKLNIILQTLSIYESYQDVIIRDDNLSSNLKIILDKPSNLKSATAFAISENNQSIYGKLAQYLINAYDTSTIDIEDIEKLLQLCRYIPQELFNEFEKNTTDEERQGLYIGKAYNENNEVYYLLSREL